MSDNPSTTLEMTMHYSQETAIPNNVPHDIPIQHNCKNLLLIDSRVREYDRIIASINNDTTYIVFDYIVDTMDTLKTKITALSMDVIVAVGIVQDNYISPNYQWLSSMQPALLQDIETMDPSLNTWTDVKDFCSFLKNEKGTLFYDLLACNTYSNPDWVYALDQLETACRGRSEVTDPECGTLVEYSGMNFRASSDTTGWGGNWILESDNVDLTTIYFTQLILQWQYTLGTTIRVDTTITQTWCDTGSNWPAIIAANVTITFTSNISLNSNFPYFIIGGDNVTIDGGGFIVTLHYPGINYAGWSGLVENGTSTTAGKNGCTIKNIGMSSNFAALAADTGYLCRKYFGCGTSSPKVYCTNNNVFNCYNKGPIGFYNYMVYATTGGIFGIKAGSNYGNINAINCYNNADVDCYYGGGIFGAYAGSNYGNATATNCYNTGRIYTTNSGGIFGMKGGSTRGNATATNCYNIGDISSTSNGGIFGSNTAEYYGNATATNCYNTGNISGTNNGGIFGDMGISSCIINAINCYSSGNVTGTSCAGIFGYNNGYGFTTMTNCYVVSSTTTITGSAYNTSVNNSIAISGSWNDTSVNTYLSGTADGTSNIWLNLKPNSNTTTPYLLTYNCTAELIKRFTTITGASTAFVNTSGYNAATTKPIITSCSGSSGAYTITFTRATCTKNVITNYKYATSTDNLSWPTTTAEWSLFYPALTYMSTTATMPYISGTYVKILAVDVVDGPSSIAYQLGFNNIFYSYGGITASVIGFVDGIVSVSIPSTITAGINTYSVTSIVANAFQNCGSLTSITLPSSLTSIYSQAFLGCNTLSSVIFSPNNVLTSIGANAFSGCIALTDINFTNITTTAGSGWSVGNNAFTSSLKNVVFGTILPTANTAITTFTNAVSATAIAYNPSGITISGNLLSNFASVLNIVANNLPTNVAATSTTYSSASVTFTPVSAQPPITNYKYSVDGGNTWTLCSPAITTGPFTISGLSSGTTYSVSIKAINFIGDGPASAASTFTTTNSTIGPFSTIGTNSFLGINNIPNLSVNTNCLAFHAPMGVYFTNPNLYAPTAAYFNFNSNKGFNFKAGTTLLATIDNVGSLWCNGLNVVGSAGGGGNITCESNMIVLGKVACSKLQISSSSTSSTIASIRCLNVIVGTCTSGIKTGNVVTYQGGVTYIDITKLFFNITFNNNYGYYSTSVFSSTIVSVTTTTMTFNVQRTDSNAAWTNNLIAQIIITETA